MLVGDADDEGALAVQDLGLDSGFGQVSRLVVHGLALVRRWSRGRRADPCFAPVAGLCGIVTVIGSASALPSVPFSERTRRISPSRAICLALASIRPSTRSSRSSRPRLSSDV